MCLFLVHSLNNNTCFYDCLGLIYLPEIKYRRILNQAFGPGGWALMPYGEVSHIQVSMITPLDNVNILCVRAKWTEHRWSPGNTCCIVMDALWHRPWASTRITAVTACNMERHVRQPSQMH